MKIDCIAQTAGCSLQNKRIRNADPGYWIANYYLPRRLHLFGHCGHLNVQKKADEWLALSTSTIPREERQENRSSERTGDTDGFPPAGHKCNREASGQRRCASNEGPNVWCSLS